MDEEVKRGRKPKVTEVETETPQKESTFVRGNLRRDEHPVIINGKKRIISRATFDVLSKDPQFNIELPKDTMLAEPKLTPCKNC